MLILLPTAASKLQAQWQGPYEVVRPVGNVNYLLRLHDRSMRQKVYHLNMLRKWHTPERTNYFVQDVPEDVDSQEEIPEWRDEEGCEPTIGDWLSHPQQDQLKKLLEEYKEVFPRSRTHITCQASHHDRKNTPRFVHHLTDYPRHSGRV